MAKAGGFGPSTRQPLTISIPTKHASQKIQPSQDYGQDLVSPLSYRANEKFPKLGDPGSEISPLSSPSKQTLTVTSSKHLPPIKTYTIPQRKPVGGWSADHKGNVVIGLPSKDDSAKDHLVHPAETKTTSQRPRSKTSDVRPQQDLYAVPEFLQNHTDHVRAAPQSKQAAATIVTPQQQRSRSCTGTSTRPVIPRARRNCAICGRAPSNTERFRQCNKCVNMFYCLDGVCWANRVCHNRSTERQQSTSVNPAQQPEPQAYHDRSTERQQAAPLLPAPQPKPRPRPREPPKWEEPPKQTHQRPSTNPVRNKPSTARTKTPKRIADQYCDNEKSSIKSSTRRSGSRTIWLGIAAVVCLVLFIVIIVLASKHWKNV